MSELAIFSKLLHQKITELTPVQTLWGVIQKVDTSKKMITVLLDIDGLELDEVLCGFDGVYRLPKVEAKCLIGLINNQVANGFLIAASDYDEVFLEVGETALKIEKTGYKIDSQNENLKEVLNDMINELNKIIVIQGTSINVVAMNEIKARLNKILK